jgi:hypothetical protein
MTNEPHGWYPYRSDEGYQPEQDSWRSLSLSGELGRLNRRYWDGSKWQGPMVSNSDVMFVGGCAHCGRSTALINITEDERRPYRRAEGWEGAFAGFIAGASIIHNPIKAITGAKDAMTLKLAMTLKCLQCSHHKSLCPYCDTLNVATPGISTCRNKSCAQKYFNGGTAGRFNAAGERIDPHTN